MSTVYYVVRCLCSVAAASLLLAGTFSTAGSNTQLGAENGCKLTLGEDATCHVQLAASVAEGFRDLLLEKAAAKATALAAERWTRDRVVLGSQKSQDGLRILVGTISIADLDRNWSPDGADRPDWIRAIFERNRAILRRHGHGMVVRESTQPLDPFPWQTEICEQKDNVADREQCAKNFHRENANWQKEAMLAKYLGEPWLTHVAVIDADVVLTQLERDTLTELAQEMDRENKDLLLADEDWRVNGKGMVNGGFVLAKSTKFSQHFFRELALAHEEGPEHPAHRCISNEQLCVRGWLTTPDLEGRVLIKSGSQYNCHPKVIQVDGVRSLSEGLRPLTDHDLHAVHFMGASKAVAPRVLAVLNGSRKKSSGDSSSSSSDSSSSGSSGSGGSGTREGHAGHSRVSAGRLPRVPSSAANVTATCNDGINWTDCFTIEECLAEPWSEDPGGVAKYAFILSHSLEKPLELPLPHLSAMKYVADRHDIDILFMMPKDPLNPLDEEQRQELSEQGVKLIEVPWTTPPGMRYTREKTWCGRKDFLRLHILNLTGYSAVAFYDNDIEIQGDVVPALECAARGYFLSTSGPYSPLNLGFMALKPSPSLLEAAIDFARQANFTTEEGWAGGGFLPRDSHYPGSDCGQGFFHTLLYKKTKLGTAALQRAGVRLIPKQLDRCEWNYQLACPRRGFKCSSIRAHHKGGGRDCLKLGLGVQVAAEK